MKRQCRQDQRDFVKWIDGELEGSRADRLTEHVRGCASCRQAAEADRRLNGYLRASAAGPEVSKDFESVFWSKISRRQHLPWPERVKNWLDDWVPEPSARQAVAFAVLAFFVGNAGGVASSMGQSRAASNVPAAIEYFSGTEQLHGIARHSLAGAYLSAVANQEVSR